MPDAISKKVYAKDVMTRKVITVSPDARIFDAARIISEHNLDGIPVINGDGKLVGIVTEYDLINKTSSINISFLQKVLSEVNARKSDSSPKSNEAFKNGAKDISNLIVDDIMNKEPLTLKEDSTFDEIVTTFIQHHKVNPIPVLDDNGKLVGIISRFDILRPLNLLSYGLQK
jgi:CBS domain-containing protein